MPFSAKGGFLSQPSGSEPVDWTPAEISTLFWLDATDTTGVQADSSGHVYVWPDKNASGVTYTQSTNSYRPYYDLTTTSLQFDGSNDHLLTSTRFSLDTASPVFGAYFVTKVYSSQRTTDKMWQLGGTGSETKKLSMTGGTPGWSYRMNNGKEVFNSVELDTLHMQGWTRPTSGTYSDGDYYQDGNSQSTTSTANPNGTLANTDAITMLGAGHNGSYEGIEMDLFEFVLVDTDDTTTRQLIEGYLAWRWGLEGNLPSDHPYKSAAPTT